MKEIHRPAFHPPMTLLWGNGGTGLEAAKETVEINGTQRAPTARSRYHDDDG